MGQKLKLDFTGVESFQRAAEGIHTVKVAIADIKQSQGGNDMITVAFEVTKGADKGARVYENFPLVSTALWKLKGFLQAIGMKADGKLQLDVDKLIGKVCQINVKHEEYDGKLRARVESIMKFSADADEDVEDDVDEEEEEEATEAEAEAEEEPEEKPAKKAGKKAPMNKPEPEESDDDDDDWDDDEEEEEPEEKPAKKAKEKPAKKEKAPKKSAKKQEEEEDDDWDDDEDWDEE